MGKAKVYLSARIHPEAHAWSEAVSAAAEENGKIAVFQPHLHNPCNVAHEKLQPEVYEMDLQAMEEAQICLALPPFGRDCAWETGWFSRDSKKCLVIFIDEHTEWLRDWMIKGGLDGVITINPKTYEILSRDPILRGKPIFLIDKLGELGDTLLAFLPNK